MARSSKEIREALRTLELPPLVTREDIKRQYRRLARRYHPDRSEGDAVRMQEIARAYELLMAYIDNFRYSFDAQEIARQFPEEEHAEKFRP